MPIKNRFAETHAEITAWRRHLHQHPELMFDLTETSLKFLGPLITFIKRFFLMSLLVAKTPLCWKRLSMMIGVADPTISILSMAKDPD